MEYLPQPAKSALQRVKGMPFEWSLNPYRGCRHACLYCYARIYHSYIGFPDPGDFDRIVLHKDDLPARLRAELRTRRAPISGEIAIGTATDPYQPLEAKERLTRRLLEELLSAGCAVSITTKSPLVLRDLDLLRRFAAYGGVRVNMTVTVLADDLWHLLEPMTARPSSRVDALRALHAEGVPTTLFLAPVIPYFGGEEAFGVLDAAAQAGVEHAMVQLLRLSPGVREWLMPRLRSFAPAKAELLARLFAGRDTLPNRAREDFLSPIREARRRMGLDRPLSPPRPRQDQLSLFGYGAPAEPLHELVGGD
jgi:DNA repair photolyase